MIIQSLKQLSGGATPEIVASPPFNKFNENKNIIIAVDLDEQTNIASFQIEAYDRENEKKYLHRADTSHKFKHGPTIRLTLSKKKPEPEKIRNPLELGLFFTNQEKGYIDAFLCSAYKFLSITNNIAFEKKFVEKLSEFIEKKEDIIFNNKDKSKTLFIFFKVNGEYPIDVPQIKTAYLRSLSVENASIGMCSICLKNTNVTGDRFAFPFYVKDKHGFFQNLDEENSRKAFPICSDCLTQLDEAKNSIESTGAGWLGGIKYYIFPAALSNENIIQNYVKRFQEASSRFPFLGYTQIKTEKELKGTLNDLDVPFAFSVLFYDTSTKRFNVIKTIDDILPSTLRKVIETCFYLSNPKTRCFEFVIYSKLSKQEFLGRPAFEMAFNRLPDKYPFEALQKLFLSESLDEQFWLNVKEMTISAYEPSLCQDWNKNFREFQKTIFSIMLLKWLFSVSSLGEGAKVQDAINDYNGFLEAREDFANDRHKQAFVLGLIVRRILDFQTADRGSRPFLQKLGNFHFSDEKIKSIFRDARNKIEEYARSSDEGHQLLESCEPYFSTFVNYSPKDSDVPNEIELSFAFCCGLSYDDKELKI